jgi:glycerol-3-phosphate dehydrogenase (NAD(P)+)
MQADAGRRLPTTQPALSAVDGGLSTEGQTAANTNVKTVVERRARSNSTSWGDWPEGCATRRWPAGGRDRGTRPRVARIAVVGAGMMGSALCVPLADRGHDVRLIGTPLDGAIVAALKETGRHPGLDVAFPETVRCFGVDELDRASGDADAFVLGVSSAGIAWSAWALGPLLARHPRPVAMVTKGLELGPEGIDVLTDAFAKRVGAAVPVCRPVAVCGPCIAGELARRVPTLIVLAGRDGAAARGFAGWFETTYYLPRVSVDVRGVQLCAALKNAYAMGVARGAGLHERAGGKRGSIALHNYEAAIFAQAILEMGAIVQALGGDAVSAWGLPGSGDLTVTCNGGRTARFGALLGRGHRAAEARALMPGVTLECLDVLDVLERALSEDALGGLLRADLPLLSHLIELGLHDATLDMPLSEFCPA